MNLIEVQAFPKRQYPIDIRTPDGQVGLTVTEAERLLTELILAIDRANQGENNEKRIG